MDIKEIRDEVNRLEQSETNYQNCQRLSVLYSILDHHQTKKETRYSGASSEFLLAMSKADEQKALKILDEHMEAIRVLYPKEYRVIINKLNE